MSRIAAFPERIAFGTMLLAWRKRNDWTQYTVCSWAEEAGFDAISYGNLSVIEQGKAGELRQKAFHILGDVNRRVAEKDWGPIKSQDLKAKLRNAIPLGDRACPVWGAVEFWACYTGHRPIPPEFLAPAEPETIREKLLRLSWAAEDNVDDLIDLIEDHYIPRTSFRRRKKNA